MEDSPIPLRVWAFVTWQAASNKKGVAAKLIERQTGVSYKTARFMMHCIRHGGHQRQAALRHCGGGRKFHRGQAAQDGQAGPRGDHRPW